MSNPHEYRELMKAAFGYSDKTVDEVIAEHERKHAERDRPTPKAPKKGQRAPAQPSGATPRASEVAKLKDLLANAKPRQLPVGE